MTVAGNFVQEGGMTIATNGIFTVEGGNVALTNATFLFSQASVVGRYIGVGLEAGGSFVQGSGGTLSGSNFENDSAIFELYGGSLSLSGDLAPFAGMKQFGGEVNASAVSGNSYSLSNGTLTTGVLGVGNFFQSDGRVTVNGPVFPLEGQLSDYGPLLFAMYELQGGFLSCESLNVAVASYFEQTGGTNNVAGNLTLYEAAGYQISGGLLTASNIALEANYEDLAAGVSQTGGTVWVTNALTCGDPSIGGETAIYTLEGGTLVAPTIIVGDSASVRMYPGTVVGNSTSFVLAGGTIGLSNTTQRLAPALLTGYSTINRILVATD